MFLKSHSQVETSQLFTDVKFFFQSDDAKSDQSDQIQIRLVTKPNLNTFFTTSLLFNSVSLV